MKKKLFFVLIPLLIGGLSGCVKYNGQGKPGTKSSGQAASVSKDTPFGSSHNVTPATSNSDSSAPAAQVNDGESVKVYLAFGEYGLYKGQPVTNSIGAPVYLENAMELDARAGEDLPGASDVTSKVTGSHFVAWTAYNNDGKLTEYSKVPSIDKMILYASFTGGSGGGQGSQPIPPEPQPVDPEGPSTGNLPTSGYGFLFTDGSYMLGSHTGQSDAGHEQYLITNARFTAGQVFSLCDFGSNAATWVVDIDPYAFGGTSAHSVEWQNYLSKGASSYTVLQDFTSPSIYIKLKFGEDQLYFAI